MAEIKFVRRFVDLDDDSFSYTTLSDRVPREVFTELLRAGAAQKIGVDEEYGSDRAGIRWSFDVQKSIPILQKAGYTIVNADEATTAEKQREERCKASEAMIQLAQNTVVKCPKCGERLQAGSWSFAMAIMRCYSDKYTAVLRADGKIEDQGFDAEKNNEYDVQLSWERIIARKLEDPEGFAKEKAEELEKQKLWNTWQAIQKWEGEYPADQEFPQGEELVDAEFKPNIYGGGVWYIIQSDAIWIVQNNGADGDDWSRNNVRTGGAGAIGKKCKRTAELEELIRLRGVKEEGTQ